MKIIPIEAPSSEEILIKYSQEAKTCYQKTTGLRSAAVSEEQKQALLDQAARLNADGHHSPLEFTRFHFFVEDASKFILILMTTVDIPYNAMARSLRYREPGAPGYSGVDYDYCEKWRVIFSDLIRAEYGDIPDRTLETDANQNSRGFVSLFSPSYSFDYSIDTRNLCYLINWLQDFASTDGGSLFMCLARQQAADLALQLKEMCPLADVIKDNKGGSLDLFIDTIPAASYGRSFTHNFRDISFDCAAHIVRHRKDMRYWVYFDEKQRDYYAAPILRKNPELYAEYVRDMDKLSDLGMIPGASLMTLSATGNYKSVMWSLLERAECGSVLLETQRAYQNLWKEYHDSLDVVLYPEVLLELEKYYKVPKGATGLFTCQHPCYWGCGGYEDRLI